MGAPGCCGPTHVGPPGHQNATGEKRDGEDRLSPAGGYVVVNEVAGRLGPPALNAHWQPPPGSIPEVGVTGLVFAPGIPVRVGGDEDQTEEDDKAHEYPENRQRPEETATEARDA